MGTMKSLWAMRSDGEEFQIEASISQVEAAGKKMFTVILRDVTERKQAEQIRERLAAVVDSSDDAIINKSLDGTIVAWNRGAEKVYGYSASEIMGKSMRILIPPDRVGEEAEILTRIKNSESVEHFETVRVRKDGRKIDVSVTISPIRDSSGTIIGASKIARDITERKRIEEALREQAQVLDLATVFVRDTAGHIVVWNQGAEKLYGYSKQEAVGKISHELLQTEFPGLLDQIESKLLTSGTWEGELSHRKRDGSKIVVASTWVLYRDSNGQPIRIVEANTDITFRKQAEEQLSTQAEELFHQAEELARSRYALETQSLMLQSVLDSMAEGLVATDEKGKFVIWNPAAEKILGLGAANMPSQHWSEHYGLFLSDTVTPFPTNQLPLVLAIRGESSSAQMFVRNPSLPEGAWIEASAGPLKDKENVIRGGVVAFRDITQKRADDQEIRRLNEELEQRVIQRTAQLEEANKELEAFTYSVSHDLRAPLRHMAGFSGILLEEYGPSLDAQAKKYLDRIQDATGRMGRLVDELLTLARVGRQSPNLQMTGLDSIVQEVVTILEPDTEGRQINWKISKLPFVECDPTLIKQVFQNLISNALKYSRPRAKAVIEVGQTDANGHTAIFIRDNGVGFSMKYADKLFGVFQRLHRAEDFEGTGVGLATVQRIIKKHHGRIWAEAELDRGATFYFTLGGLEHAQLKTEAASVGA
jgi:PAS domain S-box-containing protein